jgi:hypothetical protein
VFVKGVISVYVWLIGCKRYSLQCVGEWPSVQVITCGPHMSLSHSDQSIKKMRSMRDSEVAQAEARRIAAEHQEMIRHARERSLVDDETQVRYTTLLL